MAAIPTIFVPSGLINLHIPSRITLLLLLIISPLYSGCQKDQTKVEWQTKEVEGRIAFESQRMGFYGGLFLYEKGSIIPITKNYGGDPKFAKDGKKIYFRVTGTIFVYDIETKVVKKLDSLSEYQPCHFDIDPNNKRIVFDSRTPFNKDEGTSNLYIANIDGSEYRQITFFKNIPDKLYHEDVRRPRWSPDGETILFKCADDVHTCVSSANALCTIKPDGSDLKRIVREGECGIGIFDTPAWSPDSKQIVFNGYQYSDDPRDLQIFIVNADGSNLRRITYTDYNYLNPIFSPDGKHILYSSLLHTRYSDIGTGAAFYTMNLDGSNETLILEPQFIGKQKGIKGKRGFATDKEPAWYMPKK